ncbi:hypothetical protein M0208_06365 [Sphingomonas sp. SUN019]|uniref:hypothetical protein n=1 Tax=Sphingomonas sp. SUN019 TaxID=2937788 RepID=UPI00216439C4|nr:hypothetical protein [Sphingomonas sp. SUN019]UVO50160.1 hypothetical protein M0208_06365 [Sphingomonas sp. SUN019]
MTDRIAGDWRMLVGEEPIGPDNHVYSFADGVVLSAVGIPVGSYCAADDGGYRILLGEQTCVVRAVGDGVIETMTGSVDSGNWSDPVVFSRVRYDVRPPYGIG